MKRIFQPKPPTTESLLPNLVQRQVLVFCLLPRCDEKMENEKDEKMENEKYDKDMYRALVCSSDDEEPKSHSKDKFDHVM